MYLLEYFCPTPLQCITVISEVILVEYEHVQISNLLLKHRIVTIPSKIYAFPKLSNRPSPSEMYTVLVWASECMPVALKWQWVFFVRQALSHSARTHLPSPSISLALHSL